MRVSDFEFNEKELEEHNQNVFLDSYKAAIKKLIKEASYDLSDDRFVKLLMWIKDGMPNDEDDSR